MRTGKIARLPLDIRTQLNHRLQSGASAGKLLPWLNALPEVRAVLQEHFHSRPINAPNLSHWTHGGYRTWLHQQECHDLAHALGEDTTAFTSDHPPLTDTLNHCLTARLTLLLHRIGELHETDPDASHKLLRKTICDLAILQRSHTQARREQRHREQLAYRQDQLRQKTEAAHQQTIADHEAWALHPANQDRLYQLRLAAYPDHFVDVPDEPSAPPTTSHKSPASPASHPSSSPRHPTASEENLKEGPAADFEDESDKDFDDQSEDNSDNPSTVHSESGPAAGTVILSEVVDDPEPAEREGPHTSALASTASPHQSAPKGPSTQSKSLSHQPSLPPAVQAAIHEELSITRTELRILRLRMGLPPDPVPSRKEAVSCL